jgi:predicted RNA binding protein YcfA (HicA-like mRNA interferase family)
MANVGPIKRTDLIHYLRKAGYLGPRTGGKHEFMQKGKVKLAIPNPHRGDISKGLLLRLLGQAEVTQKEWEAL